MCRLRNLLALVLLLWGGPAWAAPAYVGGASNHAFSTTASVTYTATAGNLLFMHLSGNDYGTPATCNTPSGWTSAAAQSYNGSTQLWRCTFWKIAAGSDALSITLTSNTDWALGVVEFSGVASSGTFVTSAEQWQNGTTTPTSGTTSTITAGDLVLATLADGYESGAGPVTPSGYTGLTLSPASQVHYGTSFLMMGAIAWKNSAGGAESATWTLDDAHHASVGVWVFAASSGGGGGGPASRMTLTGVGR